MLVSRLPALLSAWHEYSPASERWIESISRVPSSRTWNRPLSWLGNINVYTAGATMTIHELHKHWLTGMMCVQDRFTIGTKVRQINVKVTDTWHGASSSEPHPRRAQLWNLMSRNLTVLPLMRLSTNGMNHAYTTVLHPEILVMCAYSDEFKSQCELFYRININSCDELAYCWRVFFY